MSRYHIHIPPIREKYPPNTRHTGFNITMIGVFVVLLRVFCQLCGSAAIGGREGLVPRAKYEGLGILRDVSSDLVQVAFDGEAEAIKVQIIQIVVERVLDFLTDLKESEKQERRERGSRDREILERAEDLERKEEQVEPQ